MKTLAIALSTGMVLLALGGRQTTGEPRAFWEKMIEVKGGRQRLEAVTGFVVMIDGRYAKPIDRGQPVGEIHYTHVYQLPDRFWLWQDDRPRRHDAFSVAVSNGLLHQAWFAYGGGPATAQTWRDSDLVEIIQRDQLMYFLETRFLKPKPVRLTMEPSGRTGDLEVEVPGFAHVVYTVDLQTYLPTRCRLSLWAHVPNSSSLKEIPAQVTVFEKYATADGLNLPSEQQGERSNLSFIINPSIDPKLFETAPNGVSNRDEWKKYLRTPGGK